MGYKDKERQRSYQHQHYLDNKDKWRERRIAKNRSMFDRMVLIKESSPCTDCGEFYPYFVMDFDHVRGNKTANISRLTSTHGGIKKILHEIEKCDLVCANCHRYRTQQRNIPA